MTCNAHREECRLNEVETKIDDLTVSTGIADQSDCSKLIFGASPSFVVCDEILLAQFFMTQER